MASRYWVAQSPTYLKTYEGPLNSSDRTRLVSRHVTQTEDQGSFGWRTPIAIGRVVPAVVMARGVGDV